VYETVRNFCLEGDKNLNFRNYDHIGLWIQGGKPNDVNRDLKESQTEIIDGVSLLIRRNYPSMVMSSDKNLSYKLIDLALRESICFEKFIENLDMLKVLNLSSVSTTTP